MLDASALLIPQVGLLPPGDPRVQGTIAAIERRLPRNGFVVGYDTGVTDDGLPRGAGALLPSSVRLADTYMLAGRTAEAQRLLGWPVQRRRFAGGRR